MDKAFESVYHRLEREHWWLLARHDFVTRSLLAQRLRPDCRILDIGCSSGGMIEELARAGFANSAGIDSSPEAARACRDHGIHRVALGDAQTLPFAERTFDVLIASDILEHVADPVLALREWKRVLARDGRMIV